jgi:hypothetical protein
MMRPTTTPSASTSKSSRFHSPGAGAPPGAVADDALGRRVDALGQVLEPAPTPVSLNRRGGDTDASERSIIESEHGGVYPQPRSREGQRRTCPYILAPCKPDGIRSITFHGGSARRHDCAASGAGCGRRAERAHAHAFEFLGIVAHRLTRGGGFRGSRDRLVAWACRVATWCAVQRVAKPVS